MRNLTSVSLLVAIMLILLPLASFALDPYYQDFEGLVQSNPSALAGDGWLVYGNVFAPDNTYLYGYGPFPAPNHSLAFSQIVLGEGGAEQGEQALVVFSDYENSEHGNGFLIESNVYQEQVIGPDDVGTTWCFRFQHKRGNIEGNTTAVAFIKTLDPDNNYALTNYLTVDMTSIPDTWGGDSLSIFIDDSLENQLLQIGFSNLATYYEGSGILYDNLAFEECDGTSGVPGSADSVLKGMGQSSPNPFTRTTRIEFALQQPGRVDLSVFDISGRHVRTLSRSDYGAGLHHVIWDGLTSDGARAPSGAYLYVLRTVEGTTSGRLILAR